jgi:hypothetical protein
VEKKRSGPHQMWPPCEHAIARPDNTCISNYEWAVHRGTKTSVYDVTGVHNKENMTHNTDTHVVCFQKHDSRKLENNCKTRILAPVDGSGREAKQIRTEESLFLTCYAVCFCY